MTSAASKRLILDCRTLPQPLEINDVSNKLAQRVVVERVTHGSKRYLFPGDLPNLVIQK
jgi:hypothetical protein